MENATQNNQYIIVAKMPHYLSNDYNYHIKATLHLQKEVMAITCPLLLEVLQLQYYNIYQIKTFILKLSCPFTCWHAISSTKVHLRLHARR